MMQVLTGRAICLLTSLILLSWTAAFRHQMPLVSHLHHLAATKNKIAPLTTDEVLAKVASSVERSSSEIVRGLNGKGWAVVDNFLDLDLCKTMRNEAGKLYESNTFTVSKSTRWDSATGSSVYYDKHNVFSTQLNGGEQYYSAPRLHEYVVSMTRSLVPILSSEYPEASLSPTAVSNKLAVCTGNGSAYDKHYDNSGMEDTRKVLYCITVL